MVVVSDGWVRNVANYQQQNSTIVIGDDMVIPSTEMCAKAVLICRPNSHPFQERTLCLDQPIKVGRSVARARAAQNNAIFDCKVLSRHHALLWYENGKFFLQVSCLFILYGNTNHSWDVAMVLISKQIQISSDSKCQNCNYLL